MSVKCEISKCIKIRYLISKFSSQFLFRKKFACPVRLLKSK